MYDQTNNPYASPATRSEPPAKRQSYTPVFSLRLWALLAGALWLIGPRFATVFSDFDLDLPLITVLVLNPWLPLGIATVGLALFVASLTKPEERERRWLAPLSILLGGALVGIIVLALFVPLVSLIENMN